jgi:glycerophosphoryl diester phosphodiesterase
MRQLGIAALLSAGIIAFGCGGGASTDDAGAADAGTPDTGPADTGVAADTGTPDTGPADSGFLYEPSIAKMIKDTSHHYRMIMAHRGGAGESPENTVAAYEHAAAIPAHSIEIDTHVTRDGVIVIMHDDTLDRTTNCTGLVADKTYDELKACEVDIYSYEAFPDHASRHIPTLDEVFAWVRGKTFINLDAKDVTPDLLVPKIREYALEDQVIYQAGSIEGCQALEKDYPGIFCLAVIHLASDLDVVKQTLTTNFIELGEESLYTKENMDLAHQKGLKVTMDIMGTYDLMPYQDKVAYMRLGADMFQSDLPTQWKRVVETLNK